MSRFSSWRGRVYLGLLLPLLAAPWCAGCAAPTYVMGGEDDVVASGGGTTTAEASALLNSGAGGKVGTTSSGERSSSVSSGGASYARTVPTEGGAYPANGGAFNTAASTTEALGAQGGTESTPVTSLDWTRNVGGAEGSGGARAVGGNTGAQTSLMNGGATTSSGVISTGGAQSAGGTKGTTLIVTGGAKSTGGTTSTGGALITGSAPSTGGLATGGAPSTGGTKATGGTTSTGGVATGGIATGGVATGGTPSTGGTSSGSVYCSTYIDLGTRASTGTEYKQIPVAATCYRFAIAATNEVFRGIQMSNCDTRTVTINGTNPGCSPSTNCSVAMYLARASDGYFYVKFSLGSSTNCTSTWWWSP